MPELLTAISCQHFSIFVERAVSYFQSLTLAAIKN